MFVKGYNKIVDLDFTMEQNKKELLREFKKENNLLDVSHSYIESRFWKQFLDFVEKSGKYKKNRCVQ